VKVLYAVWVKLDETLPWIELKETYESREAAQKAARELLGKAMVKVMKIEDKEKPIKALVTVKQ